jgi:ubiquitin-protein ligase
MGFPYPAPAFSWRKDISHVQFYANVCIHELSKEWKMTVMHVLSPTASSLVAGLTEGGLLS